jgi:hypothetical protein
MFITALTRALHWLLFHMTPSYESKVHFNIINPPTSRSSKWSLSFWLSDHCPVCIPRLHSCYMPSPCHPVRLDYSNYTWQRVQITKLLVMQFFPLSRHLISLRSKIFLSTLFSNTLSLWPSLNVRDLVSHPYRTTGKIIVLYILIYNFFDSRREDRRFWTE